MGKKRTVKKQDAKDELESGKLLTLELTFPNGTASAFSNHMTVQFRSDGIFQLSFFEVAHPIVLGGEEEVLRQMDSIDSVQAPCVSRLVVSAVQMKRMISAFAESYEN